MTGINSLVVAIVAAGCSFGVVSSTPRLATQTPCASKTAPTVDLIAGLLIAATGVIAGAVIAGGEPTGDGNLAKEVDAGFATGIGFAVASLPLASAVYGYSQRGHCLNSIASLRSAESSPTVVTPN